MNVYNLLLTMYMCVCLLSKSGPEDDTIARRLSVIFHGTFCIEKEHCIGVLIFLPF